VIVKKADLRLVVSKADIDAKIAAISSEIDQKYHGEPIAIVMIMKGSICFAADLLRSLESDATLDYISCSSYAKKCSWN